MSQRRSKRKRPEREEFILNEKEKIEEDIFDKRTMRSLGYMFTHKIISKLLFIIAKGKEANIYLAEPGSEVKENVVVVKIFRIETSNFKNRVNYIVGDPRFTNIKQNIYNIVKEWCKKEYGNLKIAHAYGVSVPKPYSFDGNVLTMEFIGENGVPSKLLKDTYLKEPEKMLDMIIENIRKLYEAGLVHADLSEYNILVKKEDKPYLIDFGQAVALGHPNATNFLRRDVYNILSYFRKRYRIERNEDKVFEEITK